MDTYKDIRPYTDLEVNKILLKYIDNPTFFKLASYVYPNWSMDNFNLALKNIKDIHSFQETFIHPAVKACIEKSMHNFSFSGISKTKLNPNKAYLFISNHRDIVLDSSLLYYALHLNNYPTGQIAIGDNLIISNLTGDLVRLNKSFLVHRNLDTRESLLKLKTLSAYIHQILFHDKESIWISQREGRTKDGNDSTHSGVLKMLALHTKDKIEYLLNAHIVPVAISYEYESCDSLKAKETLQTTLLEGKAYEKEPMEDVESIIYGITQQKGRVHFAFGNEITPANTILERNNTQEQIKKLCQEIDKQIHKNTKLFPTHYIAHDLLHNSNNYQHCYTSEEKNTFKEHLATAIQNYGSKHSYTYKKHFLSIYVNTLHNTLKINH